MKPFSTTIFQILTRRYIRKTATQCWAPTPFQPEVLKAVLDTTWDYYFDEAVKLPPQKNPGNWLVMNLAVMTLGAHEALTERGFDNETANGMIYQVTWKITSSWTKLGKRLTAVFFHKPMKHLYFLMNFVMKTLFSPPGYCYQVQQAGEGFALDVHRCPVAELMAAKGIPELCVRAWCSVDGGVVELVAGQLERSGTLAMGKEKCDFVFLPADK